MDILCSHLIEAFFHSPQKPKPRERVPQRKPSNIKHDSTSNNALIYFDDAEWSAELSWSGFEWIMKMKIWTFSFPNTIDFEVNEISLIINAAGSGQIMPAASVSLCFSLVCVSVCCARAKRILASGVLSHFCWKFSWKVWSDRDRGGRL